MEKSFSQKAEFQSGSFEAPEVGVQGGERNSCTDGEGGEVGVHPNLGRAGRNGGESQPEFAGACGFGIEAVDLGPGVPVSEDGGGFVVGWVLGLVNFMQRGSRDQA